MLAEQQLIGCYAACGACGLARPVHPALRVLPFAPDSSLLSPQRAFKGVLRVQDKLPVASRIDKHARPLQRIAPQFLQHVKVAAVRPEKRIAGQCTQHDERVLKILRNAGIAGRMVRRGDKVILRPEAYAAHDYDIAQRSARFPGQMRAQRPGGASPRVTGGLVRRQGDIAQADQVPGRTAAGWKRS